MISDKSNNKHYSAQAIERAINSKQAWLDAINNITGRQVTGATNKPCPVCGGNDRFTFDDNQGMGNSYCRQCGNGGMARTGLKLIQDILEIDFNETCNLVGEYLNLTPEEFNKKHTKKAKPLANYNVEKQELDPNKKALAEKTIKDIESNLWDISNTLAQEYLKHRRGLNVDYPIANLYFSDIHHYDTTYKKESTKPALLARLTSYDGGLEAYQRIYLKPNGEKLERKQTLRLTNNTMLDSAASVKLFPKAKVMGIAEGVETALAAHELTKLPVDAAINAKRLENWKPPEICKVVYIFSDLDHPDQKTGKCPGHESAVKLFHKLVKSGLIVYLLTPGLDIPEGKHSWDFNDFYNSVRGLTFNETQLKSLAIDVPPDKNEITKDESYAGWKSFAPISIYPHEQIIETKSGAKKPKATLDNLSRMLEYYKIKLNYNEILKQPEYTFPTPADFINKGEDLKQNAAYGQIVDLMAINNMSKAGLDNYLTTIQQKNTYNPVKDWIFEREWDKHDYIQDLLDTIEMNKNTANMDDRELLKKTLVTKWLLGACALATGITNEFPFVLTLQSHAQGIGKTFWFRQLCPADWRVDGVTLEVGKPDSEREALGAWLCELGEVDGTIRASTMERIKSFLSRDRDELRTPYDKYSNKYKRRTAFFGSCNPTEFLKDDENRRFWVLPVTNVNSYHTVDMQQVWAQCYYLLRNGESYLLDKETDKLLRESNQQFVPEHVVEAAIKTTYVFNATFGQSVQSSVQKILEDCGFNASDRQKYGRVAGRYCRKIFGEPKVGNGKTLYTVPSTRNSKDVISTFDVNNEKTDFFGDKNQKK